MCTIKNILANNRSAMETFIRADEKISIPCNSQGFLSLFKMRFSFWQLSMGNTVNLDQESAYNALKRIGKIYGDKSAGFTVEPMEFTGELSITKNLGGHDISKHNFIDDFYFFYIMMMLFIRSHHNLYSIHTYLYRHLNINQSNNSMIFGIFNTNWQMEVNNSGKCFNKHSILKQSYSKLNEKFDFPDYLDVLYAAIAESVWFTLCELNIETSLDKVIKSRFRELIESFPFIRRAAEHTIKLISVLPKEKCVWAWADNNIKYDEEFRFHSIDSPAVAGFGKSEYYIHGVKVPENVIIDPHSMNPKNILGERNQEVKRVMLELYGLDRLVNDKTASVIHSKKYPEGTYRLICIEDSISEDGEMVYVQVICPSTRGKYILRVPPEIETVDEAVAWSFGFTKDEYHPILQS